MFSLPLIPSREGRGNLTFYRGIMFNTVTGTCGGEKIIAGDMENLLNLLKDMSKIELALAELYKSCAARWKQDEDFWVMLEREERRHAEIITKIGGIVSERLAKMETGRRFAPAAIQTFLKGVRDYNELVKKGGLQREKMFFIARDIENSIIEGKYAEVVKTNDLEYQTLMKEVMSDTYKHRKLIDQKIEEAKK